MPMTILVAILAGGSIGAVARFALSNAIHARLGTRFPAGTLAVNASGSFLLGLLLPVLHTHASPALTAFVTVGCLSAFTTFSSFAWDSVALLRERRRVAAAVYILASVGCGLLALLGGLLLSQFLL